MQNNVNQDIHRALRIAGVWKWQLARALDISEPTLYRKLRQELPEDEKAEWLAHIEALSNDETHAPA